MGARTALVNVTGEQLLAGAGFAGDQHGRFAVGDVFGELQLFLKRWVLGDDRAGRRAFFRPRLSRRAGGHPVALKRPENAGRQDFRRKGFEQVIEGAVFHRLHGAVDGAVSGHHDDRRPGRSGFDFAEQLLAVHLRHFDIAEDQIEGFLVKLLKRLLAVVGGDDGVTFAFQRFGQSRPHFGFVIDDQNMFGILHFSFRPTLES